MENRADALQALADSWGALIPKTTTNALGHTLQDVIDREGVKKKMAEEAKANAPTRTPKPTTEDIRLMAQHLHRLHKVNPMDLIGEAFSKLATRHAAFHGQDDHWKTEQTSSES